MTLDRSFRFIPEQASTMAGQVDLLTVYLMLITVFFTLLILVLVSFFALRYRRDSNDFRSPNPPEVPTDMRLEIAWTVIPLGLVMVMFVWGSKLYMDQSTPPKEAMEVHIIGKQWMWKAQHPDGRREINQLTVPVGRPVKLVMTSQDVIHSYFIPAFRIKADVLPGRYSYQWFEATVPGVYRLYCTEYCGTQHSGMIGTVRVLKEADYKAWLDARPAGTQTPYDVGRAVYMDQFKCYTCHGVGAPSLDKLYGSKVDIVRSNGQEQTVTADYDYLRESILFPRAKIVKGQRADVMPTYQGQLSEEQLMGLIEYIKAGGPGKEGLQPGQRMQEQAPRSPDLSTSESNSGKTKE